LGRPNQSGAAQINAFPPFPTEGGNMQHETPQYVRVSEIARNRRTGVAGILPISNATWWSWVKSKRAPQPIKLSPGVTVWDKAKVIAFAESMASEAA
jgi:predicted DNA-binding transcriptional regulator AlpA